MVSYNIAAWLTTAPSCHPFSNHVLLFSLNAKYKVFDKTTFIYLKLGFFFYLNLGVKKAKKTDIKGSLKLNFITTFVAFSYVDSSHQSYTQLIICLINCFEQYQKYCIKTISNS